MKFTINTSNIKIRKMPETPNGGVHRDKRNEYKRNPKHKNKEF